jgi:integrase
VYPSTDELKAILAAPNTTNLVGKRDFALLYTLATTCRRASEILLMRWGDIQATADGYQFRYIYKGGKLRKSVLHRTAYQAICAYLEAAGRPVAEMEAGDWVWLPLYPDRVRRLPSWQRAQEARAAGARSAPCSAGAGTGPSGGSPSGGTGSVGDRPEQDGGELGPLSNHQANSILKKYARRTGMDVKRAHIHGLRHAGARLRVEQMKAGRGGVDYMELMALLGHSSLAVTQIYSQTCLEDPEDPGADAAAAALIPKGDRKRKRAKPVQEALL